VNVAWRSHAPLSAATRQQAAKSHYLSPEGERDNGEHDAL
jgi:hypothetical protein